MHTSAVLVVPCAPSALFGHVATLDRYPPWMRLIHHVETLPDDNGRPAWHVELRTRVGPLARSKRLRMVRTEVAPDALAVFERTELDARHHSPWVLRAELEPLGQPGSESTRLRMHLSYGGSLWTGGILQRVLDDEIRRGSDGLLELVNSSPTH